MVEKRMLAAFDFDHTLVDQNSDLYVRKLLPNGKVPDDIKAMYSDKGWIEYMNAIFACMHKHGTQPKEILDCMTEITFVPGMDQLVKTLSKTGWDIVIISDSNSVFIKHILEGAQLEKYFAKVYTNPAKFNEEGQLEVNYYHTQDWCDLSTINLCKGDILESHISERKKEGVEYTKIAYIGDGTNDLCPSLRLKEKDFVFPREGLRLIKAIEKIQETKTFLAPVYPWNNGMTILNQLEHVTP